MAYDKQYYDNRKQELNQEAVRNILEAYDDIKRAVIKEANKTQEIQRKFQELEAKEKESQTTGTNNPKIEPAQPTGKVVASETASKDEPKK